MAPRKRKTKAVKRTSGRKRKPMPSPAQFARLQSRAIFDQRVRQSGSRKKARQIVANNFVFGNLFETELVAAGFTPVQIETLRKMKKSARTIRKQP